MEGNAFIPIRVVNPFFDLALPEKGELLAVLDTGYTGFLLLPEAMFRRLRFHELRVARVKGVLADGREVPLMGAYGSIAIPEINFLEDGLIETNPEVREVLLGMEGLRELRAEIDGCLQRLSVEKC